MGDYMKEFFSNLKFAWQFTRDQKKKFILNIFYGICLIFISVCVPILSAKVIVTLTKSEFKQLLMISIVILVVEWSRNIFNYLGTRSAQIIYREGVIKVQTRLGREILKLENNCLDEKGTGLFIQRMNNDTSKLADIYNVISSYGMEILTNIGIFAAIFIINKVVFCYLFIMMIILYLVERKRTIKRNENDKAFRKKGEKVAGFTSELIRGTRDIKMLNSENSFIKELANKINDMNSARYKMQNTDRNYKILRGTILDFSNFLLIALLIYLLKTKMLVVTNALILYNYSSHTYFIITYLGTLMESVKDFNLSASRIFSIINDDKEFTKEKFGTKHLDKVNGDFEFKDVSFSYGKHKVLNDLSFKIKANSTVAFVGKSGAGKTTIFNLLCKMYDIDSGKITIDGINIKELDKDSIRGNITIISQDPYIFNLSIKDNLRLVKEDLTDEEMVEACKMACLDKYIDTLPDKYDTIIGEGGVNLSGGQKQRLAIARAFVQKTEIILFDEATSALDNETQANIQKAIENMRKEYTILIIAHRLSTIIDSDRILLLNDGKIEIEGKHDYLLANSETYRNLYNKELQKDK
jgi:ABC-type multidrug transport system fused ATPase/permease subunit